jgi:EAL domain-containing protein (putative c-di-GMP-specific phosphodiesterase class I)
VDGLADLVASCLAASGCEPRHFGIEITESSLIEETKAVPVLNALRELGVTIAIDDFGTAYSSMSRLRNLPIDTLKIDRSFLTNITDQEDAATIAESLVKVGRSLEKLVIAEGVETIRQLELLRKMGCHQAQGFLLARPMAAVDAPAWIEEWRRQPFCDNESGRWEATKPADFGS